MPKYVARVSSVHEPVPIAYRPKLEFSKWDRLVLLVLRPAWACRVELVAALLLLLAERWLVVQLGRTLGLILFLTSLAVLIACPPTRRWLLRQFYRSSLRRRWALAVRHAGLANHNDRVPRIIRWRPIPSGDRCRIRVPAGGDVPSLEARREAVAAFLGAREVRVTRDPAHAGRADVVIVRRDLLAAPVAELWPGLAAGQLSLWDPIPIGLDENGETVRISLFEFNMLVGGEPRAGKSVLLSMPVATAALDPSARLVLLDGKRVELSRWRRSASEFVGADVPGALEVLDRLRAEMHDRYAWLEAHDRRKLRPEDGRPLCLVAIDEMALFLNTGDRRLDGQIEAVLRELVSLGPAAGIIVIGATQKSSGNLIPTDIRDLFSLRLAFRCTTPQHSDTVLGQGWASAGYSATTIDSAHRGVGYLLAEGALPRRLRTFHLTDEHLGELVARAAAVREAGGAAPNGDTEQGPEGPGLAAAPDAA